MLSAFLSTLCRCATAKPSPSDRFRITLSTTPYLVSAKRGTQDLM